MLIKVLQCLTLQSSGSTWEEQHRPSQSSARSATSKDLEKSWLKRENSQDGLPDCIANDDGERQIANALSFSGDEEVCLSSQVDPIAKGI